MILTWSGNMMITSSQTTPRWKLPSARNESSLSNRHAHFEIVDVMDFIKDDPLDVANQISTFVQHAPQHFRLNATSLKLMHSFRTQATYGHYEAACIGIDLNVTCKNPNTVYSKCRLKVAELLIGQGLNWRCVNGSEVAMRSAQSRHLETIFSSQT